MTIDDIMLKKILDTKPIDYPVKKHIKIEYTMSFTSNEVVITYSMN